METYIENLLSGSKIDQQNSTVGKMISTWVLGGSPFVKRISISECISDEIKVAKSQ